MTSSEYSESPARAGKISLLISIAIVLLTAANGFFTYSGAHLYLQEPVYAILFAVAVQFAIAITLLALPYVRGFGKLILIVVYAAALTLSTLSAYTYVYNGSLPGDHSVETVDTAMRARITNDLSEVVSNERNLVNNANLELKELKRLVDEEAASGGRSGLGPGKGSVYYQKLDNYENALAETALMRKDIQSIEDKVAQINTLLASRDKADREPLLVAMASLRALTHSPESRRILHEINALQLGKLQNPVERALGELMDMRKYTVQMTVSIIWAGVFDLIALFLGVIRYYLLRPDYSIMQTVYELILTGAMFIKRIMNLGKEVNLRYTKEQGIQVEDHEIPLNSAEMRSFATKLMVGSQMAAQKKNDPSEPIRALIGHIEPVARDEESEQAVGIPFAVVEKEPRLKTLLAMLVQSGVFLKRLSLEYYVLNSDESMAQKVMVFIRMGSRDQATRSSLTSFLLGRGRDDQRPQLAVP